MSWTNCSLVTSDLFLGLEFLMYKKIVPSAVTILNLNEIVELVVLKEKLLMPTSDHIVILKNLNSKKIKDLGGNDAIDWNYELKNLGKAHLDKPLLTNSLFDSGVLVLDTEQKEDKDYRDFGDRLYSKQSQGEWILKSVILDWEKVDIIEIEYARFMNDFLEQTSDPAYLKMFILDVPDLLSSRTLSYLGGGKYGAIWMLHCNKVYQEVRLYSEFARQKSLGFTDTMLVQPFVALNFQHSESFVDIFYKQLKEVRYKQITELLDLEQPWIYNLPPLTAILLQRCRTLEDLPTELIKLRGEFKHLRESLTKYQKSYEEAVTIKDKLELKREFQNSTNLLMRKISRGKRRIMKTIIDFAVDQSNSMIRRDFVGPTKTTLGKFIEYVHDRRLYPWVNSFLHMYDASISIESDLNLYKKIFGDVNLDDFSELKLFAQNSSRLLNIHKTKANKTPRDS